VYCARENVDPETSYLLHHDPELNVPVTTAEQAEHAERHQGAVYNAHPAVAAQAASYAAQDQGRAVR
jgi:hypothetical protein